MTIEQAQRDVRQEFAGGFFGQLVGEVRESVRGSGPQEGARMSMSALNPAIAAWQDGASLGG